MGRRGRERVERELAWEHQEKGYLAVFDELSGRAPVPTAPAALVAAGPAPVPGRA
jgi:hypothetical protein